MTRLLLFVCLYSFSAIYLSAQEGTFSLLEVDNAPVLTECPESKDSKECFNESLRIHILNTVDIRKTHHTPGQAYVLFEISENGTVKNVQVRAENKKHKKEAKRVIEALNVKQAAILNGKKVALLHAVPVVFQAKLYDSYSEFMGSDQFQKMTNKDATIAFEKISNPPVCEECQTRPEEYKKNCFETVIKINLENYLRSLGLLSKKQQRIKYYFEVDKMGKVSNISINGPLKKTNRKVHEFLESMEFTEPAKDANGQAKRMSFLADLIL